MPSAEYLRAVFTYCPETGKLFWNYRDDVPKATNTRFAGKEVGSFHSSGLQVRLDDKLYMVSRIIFVVLYGDVLSIEDEVDHIDLNKQNNRKNNLRKATRSQNGANKDLQSNNTSGAKGVDYLISGKWRVRVGGKHVGVFYTREEAIEAYEYEAMRVFGNYRRVPSLQR